MTPDQAHSLATGAQRKRDANETYQLSIEELKAIDAILIEQAYQRLKREHPGSTRGAPGGHWTPNGRILNSTKLIYQ